jgi:hypothetical protein
MLNQIYELSDAIRIFKSIELDPKMQMPIKPGMLNQICKFPGRLSDYSKAIESNNLHKPITTGQC